METQILVLLNPSYYECQAVKNYTQSIQKQIHRKINNSKYNQILFIKQNSSFQNIISETASKEQSAQWKIISYVYVILKHENFGIEQFRNIMTILKQRQLENKLSILYQMPMDDQIERIKKSIETEFNFTKFWPIDQLSNVAENMLKEQVVEKLYTLNSSNPIAVLLGPSGQGKTQIFSKFTTKINQNMQTDCFDYIEVLDKFILVDSPSLTWEVSERDKCQEMFQLFYSRYSNKISNFFFVLKYDRDDMMKKLINEMLPLIREIIGRMTLVVVCLVNPQLISFDKFCQSCIKQGFRNCIYIVQSLPSKVIAEQLEQQILYEQQGINFQDTQYEESDKSEMTNNLNNLVKETLNQQRKENELKFKENTRFVQKETVNFNTQQNQNQVEHQRMQNQCQQIIGIDNILLYSKKIQEEANKIQEMLNEKRIVSASELIKKQIIDVCNSQTSDITRLYQLVNELEQAQFQEQKYNRENIKL